MRALNRISIAAAAVAMVVTAGNALHAATLTVIGPGSITDLSANGSVAVGNTNAAFETFRWTSATGVVPLGRATVPVLGVGAGTPDVSWDGTHVSATILDNSSTYATPGVWTLGSGWQQIPMVPPDGGIVDSSNASQWGMSGDGNTMTGFYWRPTGPVHAYQWVGNSVTDLGSDGRQSSGRNVNYNGSVIVGWDEDPANGQRRSTVWVNGAKTVLEPHPVGPCELAASDAAGDIVTGTHYNETTNVPDAAIWRFTGGNWVMQDVGTLTGTIPFSGGASLADISADGSIAVGFNRFSGGPGGSITGVVWTSAQGLRSASDYMASVGVSLPSNLQVQQFTSISADGNTIAGVAIDPANGLNQSFLITVPEPATAGLVSLAAVALMRRRRR